MDTTIILVYCLCDDILRYQNQRDDPQCQLSSAEVMTVGLVAALFFGGNQAQSMRFLVEQGYLKQGLSRSRYCRRLQRLAHNYATLMDVLGAFFKAHNPNQHYLLDSMPLAVCDNYRVKRCRIYQDHAYQGYQASKRRYVYGLKIHLLTTEQGQPVEFLLTPAGTGDVRTLWAFDFDLPAGAQIVGDKAYNDYRIEDVMEECGVDLAPIRKANSKRPDPPWKLYLQTHFRQHIETTNSLIQQLLHKHVHAVTAQGFELKAALFVLATTINCLTC